MADKKDEKKFGIADLNRMYQKSDNQFQALFAEQRSNLQLVAGHHYARRGTAFWRKIRNNTHLSKDQKVRVTKNHIQKITKSYVNNIVAHSPGVHVKPKNKSEFSDQKDAELNESVWYDIRKRHNFDRLTQQLAKDFIEIGEAWVKVFFDPKKGQFLGLDAEVDDDGKPKTNEDGDFLVLRKFTGDVVFERVLGFNVLTDTEARSNEESRFVIYRKMVPTKELKAQFKDDEEKLKYINESAEQTWMLFDGVTGKFRTSKGMTMVREYYFKPSSKHPNGYYYIATEDGVLYEGELPDGVFPMCYVGFDEASTSARSFSIIKQLRGPQAEINRVNSKIIEHQITLGDDKIVTQSGATLSPGGTAHGVKEIKTNGPITHLPGRTGAQYLDYLQQQIDEMYFLAGVQEDALEKDSANLDPYSLLFRNLKQKKKFVIYATKFERFLRDICDKSLRLARRNYDDEMVVQVLDKKEQVNIPEFRDSSDLSFDIVLEPQSDDIETQMGQQIALNHALQFGGASLSPEETAELVRSMPFLHGKNVFSDRAIDQENVLSDIVNMDRGVFIPADPDDNHPYYIKRLTHRMKMKDFQFLPPEVQQNYQVKRQQHQQVQQQQLEAAARATAGQIPADGFLVTADIRVPRADDPTKTERARYPVSALDWLAKKLAEQGLTQETLQSLPLSVQANIGEALAAQSPSANQPGAPPPDQGVA